MPRLSLKENNIKIDTNTKNIGDLEQLTTTQKENLVLALNEIHSREIINTVATTVAKGLMSSNDKAKLDRIEDAANRTGSIKGKVALNRSDIYSDSSSSFGLPVEVALKPGLYVMSIAFHISSKPTTPFRTLVGANGSLSGDVYFSRESATDLISLGHVTLDEFVIGQKFRLTTIINIDHDLSKWKILFTNFPANLEQYYGELSYYSLF